MARTQKSNAAPGTFARDKDGKALVDRKDLYRSEWVNCLVLHMKRTGVSQADLGVAAGIARATINHYVMGRVKAPLGDVLEKLIRHLSLSSADAEAFREDAMLANAPKELTNLIKSLRTENKSLRTENEALRLKLTLAESARRTWTGT